MPDIRKLLDQMAKLEEDFQRTQFLAPCVRGGTVRAKVAGLVQTLAPRPADFEGWGIFQSVDTKTAQVVEEADLPLIAEYLGLFPVLRVRLRALLAGQTWLAYPANEGDMRQRWEAARPLAVHLVEGCLRAGDGALCRRDLVVRGRGPAGRPARGRTPARRLAEP